MASATARWATVVSMDMFEKVDEVPGTDIYLFNEQLGGD